MSIWVFLAFYCFSFFLVLRVRNFQISQGMSKKSRTAGRNILHKWVQHFADGHYHKQYRKSNFCFLPIILCKFCILVRLYINLEIVMCLGTLGIISLCPLKLQCLFFFLSKDTCSNKFTFCSAWLRLKLKLNTKIGLHTTTI